MRLNWGGHLDQGGGEESEILVPEGKEFENDAGAQHRSRRMRTLGKHKPKKQQIEKQLLNKQKVISTSPELLHHHTLFFCSPCLI